MEQADRAAPGPSLARAAQRLSVLAAQLTSSNSGAPAAESDDFFYHPADGGSLLGPSSAFPAVIIGAVVVDVQAVPTGPTDIRKGTSVPGKVRQVAGRWPSLALARATHLVVLHATGMLLPQLPC